MSEEKLKPPYQKRIIEFPSNDQPWRIDWIDHVSYSLDDEPKIRVYLAQLNPGVDDHKALSNESLFKTGKKKCVTKAIDVKIGFIQLLKIGSVWVNGIQQLNYRNTEGEFVILPASFELQEIDGAGFKKDSQQQDPILTNFQHRIAHDARHNSWVLVLNNHKGYKKIVIPSAVIFQSCFVSSPKAASKIIFGRIDQLVDIADSGPIEDDPTVFRVSLHRDYQDNEAPLFANLLSDPAAAKYLAMLRQNIVIQSNSIYLNRFTQIKTHFPFSNALRLRVVGKTILYERHADDYDRFSGHNAESKPKLNIDKGFLVTEIQEIKTKFAFERVVIIRKNDNRKAEYKGEELLEAYGGIKPVDHGDEERGLCLTETDVSAFIKPTQLNQVCCIDTSDIELIKNEKEYQRYKSKPFLKVADTAVMAGGSSTGEKRQTIEGDSQLNIVLSPVELDAFFDVINIIDSKGINVRSLAISHSVHVKNGIINFFPQKIKGCHSWHLNANKSRTRAFIIASIYHAGRWTYLIDVEPKNAGVLSIALIWKVDYQPAYAEQLYALMKEVSRSNGWSFLKENAGYTHYWTFKAIDHDRRGNNERVAMNILRALGI